MGPDSHGQPPGTYSSTDPGNIWRNPRHEDYLTSLQSSYEVPTAGHDVVRKTEVQSELVLKNHIYMNAVYKYTLPDIRYTAGSP